MSDRSSAHGSASGTVETTVTPKPRERAPELVPLALDVPPWERVFTIAPLVLVGSREEDGSFDLAPKHMAGPMSWGNWFGFVCTPRHCTCRNARRTGVFTVSYPRPSQVVSASLAACPRCEDGTKPELAALPTIPAEAVDGVFLANAHLVLACRLEKVVDDLDENCLLIGRVVEARANPKAVRDADRDDAGTLRHAPLLAYLHPGRFARVRTSHSFPFPEGFSR
jgi:flavin reductase (DIM6/NTAB) family NADH-FMN oxidoreductase RutF